MIFFLLAVFCLLFTGVIALLFSHSPKVAGLCGIIGNAFAGALGLLSAFQVLINKTPIIFDYPMNLPFASFHVEVDVLSSLFLVLIFALSPLFALYGNSYLDVYREKKSLGPPWFFFNLLVASMTLVVTARNGGFFLVAWEMMALSSFFLVVFEGEKPNVRDAGITYLIATHLGTAFLIAMFISAS